MEKEKYYLEPGYIFVSGEPYIIHTVLGSCVSVCIWDSERMIGGMNHFILDRAKDGICNAKFGDVATRYLIRLMVDMGCPKSSLRAHIIGGGCNPEMKSLIGDKNVSVAEEILYKNNIHIVIRDVGGHTGRKLVFDNTSGEILVYKSISIRRNDWYNEYWKKD